MATAAAGTGVRLGADVLAPAGAVAGGWGLRPVASDPALRAERGRRTRLVACVCGRFSHPREKRGADTGPSPVDRRKTGSKHHLICDGRGTALKVITTAANLNDVTQTLALVDGIPPVPGRPADPADGQRPCSAAKATTPTPTATRCVADESCRSSPARDHRTSRASAGCDTSSSRPSPCSTTSSASLCAGNAAPNSTTPSSPSPAASSASDASRRPAH
ncbi:LOW QUALITY PROTEIN: transposase, partial [Streptomyces filamentosus NRRL 11379]